MTNLFTQEGITFDASSMASTSPDEKPAAITAPKINLPAGNDNAPVVSTAPTGDPNMSPSDQKTALNDLYGSDNTGAAPSSPTDSSAAPAPDATEPQGRNLFKEMGITPDGSTNAATLPQINNNALSFGIDLSNPTPDQKPAADFANSDVKQWQVLAPQLGISQQTIDNWKQQPIGPIEAASMLNISDVHPAGGFYKLYEAEAIKGISDKLQNGQQISQDEQNHLYDYLRTQAEMKIRGFSNGGTVVYYGAQVPSFLLQYAASDGVGKAAQEAILSGAEKSALTAATGVAGRLATTTTLMAPEYAGKYGERRLTDGMTITDKGDAIGQASQESPAMSALLAYTHTATDVAAMQMGPGISKYVIDPVTKMVSTPLISAVNELPAVVRSSIYDAYKTIDPTAQASKVFTSIGWKSALEGLGVTQVDNAMNGALSLATEKNYTTEDLIKQLNPGGQSFYLNAGIIGMAGALHTAIPMVTSLMESKGVPTPQAQEAANNMSALEREDYVNKNLPTPKSAYPSPEITAEGTAATANVKADVVDGDWLMRGVMPTGDPGASIEAGKVRGTGAGSHDGMGNYYTEEENPSIAQNPDENPHRYAVYRDENGKQIGVVSFDLEDPQSKNIVPDTLTSYVAPEVRRQGIASSLYDKIRAEGYNIDDVAGKGDLTPDGAAFANRRLNQVSAEGTLAAAQMASSAINNPPPIQAAQSGFNAGYNSFIKRAKGWYAELFNEYQPIEDLSKQAIKNGAQIPDGESAQNLINIAKGTPKWIERNHLYNTTTWDAAGNQVVTGKGLKPIYDDFDNMFLAKEPDMVVRHQDFEDFLQAERLLEEKKSGKDVLVTPAQEAKAQSDLLRLASKYGQDFKFFDTFAGEVRDWDNRILQNLVSNGLKTQEWFDQVTSARKKYSPLQRIVDEEPNQSLAARNIGKDPNANRIGSLKQFKGSDLEIRNTFDSRLKNSALILQKSAVNRLTSSIAKYADFTPEIKVSAPKVIRAPVKSSYDPKLRDKLEKVADFLNNSVKREAKVKVPGFKGVLGSYSPAEKMVRLKIGTTEGTLAHEIGHMLDFELGLKDKMLSDPAIKQELQTLAEDRLNSKIDLIRNGSDVSFQETKDFSSQKYLDYIKNDREVIANFYDAYVNSPEQVDSIAPRAKAEFEKIIDQDPQLGFLKDIKPSTSRAEEVLMREQRDMQGPPDSVPFYRNGKRMYLEMPKDVADAFKGMGPIRMGQVETLLGAAPRAAKHSLQFGATHYPEFMLRHFIRAVYTSFLNTSGGIVALIKHPIDIIRGAASVIRNDQSYQAWASSSGAFKTYMDLSPEGLAKMQKEMFASGKLSDFIKPMNLIKSPLTGMNALLKVADQAPRVAVFNKLKAQGMSDLAAGIGSLEATGNYGRSGSYTKRINQYAPFFNDMMQTGDRFVRSMMKDPAGFTLRATATITIPQIVLTGYYLYGADEKTRNEYLEFQDWSRAAFMHIKIGDTWIPFPRPFTPGYLFGSVPEQIMLHEYTQGYHPEAKDFWMRLMSQSATSVSPVVDWERAMNPILKSVIEDTTNYNFFKKAPIFNGDLQKTAPADQYNQYTSETGKLVGKMFNISPADIDNTVYNMSAQMGKWSLELSDAAINESRRMNGQAVPEQASRITDNPIYGKLLAEPPHGYQSESYTEFREHLNDAAQAHNVQKGLTGQEAAQNEQENGQMQNQYSAMNAFNKQIQNIEKQIKVVNKDTNMNANAKTQQVNSLSDQITQIAKSANIQFRQATQK